MIIAFTWSVLVVRKLVTFTRCKGVIRPGMRCPRVTIHGYDVVVSINYNDRYGYSI